MKVAILVLSIVGAVFSITVGTCTGICFSAIGEMGRHVGDMQTAQKASSSVGPQMLLGFVGAGIGLTGGIRAYRRFDDKRATKIAGFTLIGATVLTIVNTFQFFTTGMMFGVAALLVFLARSKQPEGPAT